MVQTQWVAGGRGTEFAVPTSIALGIRESKLQTEAMPQSFQRKSPIRVPQPQPPAFRKFLNTTSTPPRWRVGLVSGPAG
jgi:hypothetical protein